MYFWIQPAEFSVSRRLRDAVHGRVHHLPPNVLVFVAQQRQPQRFRVQCLLGRLAHTSSDLYHLHPLGDRFQARNLLSGLFQLLQLGLPLHHLAQSNLGSLCFFCFCFWKSRASHGDFLGDPTSPPLEKVF